MRKTLIVLLFCAVPALAQVSNPDVTYVVTAPSGACVGVPPIQVVISTGALYTCNNGTWGSGGGGMVYPAAGIALSTGAAWGTSFVAPTSALVGLTDTQSLTNKTVNGVVLTAAGTSTTFLNGIGTYTTPSVGSIVFPATVSGTTVSGGIPYFSTTTALSSSALLNANTLVKGGGAGAAPTNSLWTDNGTTSAYTGTGGISAPTFNGVALTTADASTTYLNGAGAYTTPAGSGTGSVTSVSVTTANGVSGTVATPTTTPAITLALGAITPSNVTTPYVSSIAYSTTQLGNPSAPTLATVGTAGTTSYTYLCTAVDANGFESNSGTALAIATGNATLSGTNYNTVTCASVANASSENVYRTVSAGTPSTTGKIGNTTNGGALNDTGLAGSGTAPTINTTGSVKTQGTLSAAEIVVPGDGTHAGVMSLYPNTTLPGLTAGDFSLLGPNSASITAYGWQLPTATNASAGLLHVAANASAVSQLSVSQVAIADMSATGTPSSTTFLRGDNTWAAPTGTGTVTSVSVVTANGVSGTVATATTTPAITLTLGAITPSSVAATGAISGTSVAATGTTAGFFSCTQGTANTGIANSWLTQCPTALASAFVETLPIPTTGLKLMTVSGAAITDTIVPLPMHMDYWNLQSALFSTATAVGSVYYEMNAAKIVAVTARLSGSITCTTAPTLAILDLGTVATTAYASATVLTSLATGTADGAFSATGLSVAVAAGHYLGLGFSAGACTVAPTMDITVGVQ